MRPYLVVVCIALSALALTACGNERLPEPTVRTATATATPLTGLTPDNFVVTADQLPGGCRLDREGEFIVGQYSRSYNCANDDRLTNTVTFAPTEEPVATGLTNRWGGLETATTNIRSLLQPRPIDPSSIQVTDVTDRFERLGPEVTQEKIYCATFTDSSGTVKVSELYGSYRYRNSSVEYTAFSGSGNLCAGEGPILDSVRALARLQFQKLRDLSAAGLATPTAQTTR